MSSTCQKEEVIHQNLLCSPCYEDLLDMNERRRIHDTEPEGRGCQLDSGPRVAGRSYSYKCRDMEGNATLDLVEPS